MTPHSLSPGFIRIDYHSAYGPHVHILPTLQWFVTSITGTMGSYAAHNGTPIDAEDMINAFVDKLAAQHKSSTVFDLATVYTQANPTGQAIPRASAALTQVGSNAALGPDKATQMTLNGRTTGYNPFKLVLLDVPMGTSNFNKIMPGNFSSQIQGIFDEYGLSSNAWSGRDDQQPSYPISVTLTMNEALRKAYRMA